MLEKSKKLYSKNKNNGGRKSGAEIETNEVIEDQISIFDKGE